MFFKFQLRVVDSSYLYLLTNLVGAVLLFYKMKKSTTKNISSLYLSLFILVNIILLGLRILDINVAGVPFASIPSVVFLIFIWICYFYNFLYPIISFTELIKHHSSNFVQRLVKIMTLLSSLLMLTFYLFYQLTPVLMFIVILLEFIILTKAYNDSRRTDVLKENK